MYKIGVGYNEKESMDLVNCDLIDSDDIGMCS